MRFSLLDVIAWSTIALVAAAAIGLGAAVSSREPGASSRPTVLAAGQSGQPRLVQMAAPVQSSADRAPAAGLTAVNTLAAPTRR